MSCHFAIIGPGRQGSAMLETLLSLDHEVLRIAYDEGRIKFYEVESFRIEQLLEQR